MQYRQGDLLIIEVQCPLKPKIRRVVKKLSLLEGEATGHCHVLKCNTEIECIEYNNEEFQNWLKSIGIEANGICGFEVKQDANLVHQEHSTIKIPASSYIAIRQREYSPEKLRNVGD